MARKLSDVEKNLIEEKKKLLDSCFNRMCATDNYKEYKRIYAQTKNLLTQIEALSRSRFLVS